MRKGSKAVAGGAPFWLEIHISEGGVGWPFLVSNVTKVTVNSGWNGSYAPMGSEGNVRSLDLVMGVLTGAQWVRNNRLRGSFLA